MIRKAFVLIGALALVIGSAVPAQARPAPPTPEQGPRTTVCAWTRDGSPIYCASRWRIGRNSHR